MAFEEVWHGTREASSCEVYGYVHRSDVRQLPIIASCRMPRGSFKRRGFCLGRSFCGGHGHSRQSPGACFRFPYRILSCGVSAVLRDQGLLQAHLGSQGRTAQGAKGALSRRAFRFCPLKGCPTCLLMLSPWFALGPAEGSLAKWHSQHDCVHELVSSHACMGMFA